MPRPQTIVHFIARNNFDHTVTLAVNGVRWEYWLRPDQCDTVEFLCRKISARKALAYARSRSIRQVKE